MPRAYKVETIDKYKNLVTELEKTQKIREFLEMISTHQEPALQTRLLNSS